MANFHKSIAFLKDKLKPISKKNAEKEISKLLNSYELQIRYGIPRLEAFENSIINPTLNPKMNIENGINEQDKKNRSILYRTLCRYEEKIKELRHQKVSYENIAKYLNSHRVSNKTIKYNKQYIYRFCKEKNYA